MPPARRITRSKVASSKSEGAASRRSQPKKGSEEALLQMVPKGLVEAFVTQKLHEKQLDLAGLAPPDDWEGDMPDIPDDVAAVDHNELSNLLGRFANAYSTALWQASTNYIEHGFYEEIAEYLEQDALLNADESNDTKRRARAKTDESVVAARSLARSSYSAYVRFRDLSKTLEFRWKTVSRVGGFVGDEAEAEDARTSKASTRGRALGSGKGTARGSGRGRSIR